MANVRRRAISREAAGGTCEDEVDEVVKSQKLWRVLGVVAEVHAFDDPGPRNYLHLHLQSEFGLGFHEKSGTLHTNRDVFYLFSFF